MVVLIAGSSHTGKTALAQKVLEQYQYPYLSIDHLKMGLIRGGYTDLTPTDDEELIPYLWPMIREIAKTAIENRQNLVIEGCYIPFNWKHDFDKTCLDQICYVCLIMTEHYINTHFPDIQMFADVIEQRLDDSSLTKEELIQDNAKNLDMCKQHGCDYLLIDKEYQDCWRLFLLHDFLR